MSSYKDEASSMSSDSLDNVEMEEREPGFAGEQEVRLLSDEDGGFGDVAYKVEWHIRTGWVIAGTITILLLMFAALVTFTKVIIIQDDSNGEIGGLKGIGDFRRSPNDYVLNPRWNFNEANKVREYNWKIADIVGNPDGVFRPMVAINGQFPGPLIECNEGDTLVIEVDNQSVNATSLHFHGLFQNGTNFMDGTTGVTQCPIAPKRKFRYEFTITGQSGTYYYHGHQAVQASDGLYGPLVVHSRNEKKLQQIPYSSDRVVMLQDHYHDLSSSLLVSALEPGSEQSPIPNGALMNGMNRQDCSTVPHRMCDNSTAALPSFGLTANANHRLRFINVGAFAWFQVTVDEHQFAITEADGTDIIPAFETSLTISPAQRYSMILNTNQSSADAFWLRARMLTHCWKNPDLPGRGAEEVKAVIRYTSTSRIKMKTVNAQPSSRNWNQRMEVQCKDMNTTSYIPVFYEPPPAVADHTYYLHSSLEIDDWRLERGFFNKSTFRPNLQDPTLHRTIEGLSGSNETFNSMRTKDGVNGVSYDIKNDFLIQHNDVKVVDLVIRNFDEGNHPMHLHGHKFWVLGQGHGMFTGYESIGLQAEGKGPLKGQEQGLSNLIRRDVATAEGFGWLALRFVADNPGVWAFHCHMAWHSEAGLVMQFLSRMDVVATWEVPEANRQLCGAGIEELEKGAAPRDSTWSSLGIGR
jgi:FtsP/CotA-like multicopper oxidase with cupredoxin domain